MRMQTASIKRRIPPMMVTAVVGSGLVGGVALGAVAGGVGVVLGLGLGIFVGVISGRVMDRENERATQKDRELDEILYGHGVSEAEAGEALANTEETPAPEPWGNEWLTPPPPVAG